MARTEDEQRLVDQIEESTGKNVFSIREVIHIDCTPVIHGKPRVAYPLYEVRILRDDRSYPKDR